MQDIVKMIIDLIINLMQSVQPNLIKNIQLT